MYVYRAYITVKGRRIYARQYGLKAFPIWIEDAALNNADTEAGHHE